MATNNSIISSLDLTMAVTELRDRMQGKFEEKLREIEDGVGIDPFAVAMELEEYGIDYATWKTEFEPRRRWQKSLMNCIGDFQQDLVGQLDGWTSHPAARSNKKKIEPDLVGVIGRRRVIVELKNARNTLNSQSAKGTFAALEKHLSGRYRGSLGIVVQLKSDNNPVPPERFAPGRDNSGRDDIVVMGGRTFYAMITDPDQRTLTPARMRITPEKAWKQSWNSIDELIQRFLAEVGLPMESRKEILVESRSVYNA